MSQTYSVIFSGEIVAGYDLEQVKKNIGQVFKLNPERVEKLFSGKPVAIKRGIDQQQANKFQNVMAKAGAVSVIRQEAGEQTAAEPSNDSGMARITCPRCAHEQAFATACQLCKMDLSLHIQRVKRREQMRRFRQNQQQAAG